MGVDRTVVFIDLTGSTGVFETLGNAKATEAVTTLTHWIGQICAAHQGRVVKTLGDGVLATFVSAQQAVLAMVHIQRSHQTRILTWPTKLRMRIKVGMARGDVEEVDTDLFGDAVNVASRLSDLSGPDQIWATDAVLRQLHEPPGTQFRSLGAITMRGKAEASRVYQVEWQEDGVNSMTVPGALPSSLGALKEAGHRIELRWLDVVGQFGTEQMPVRLGRLAELEFVVNDPRVSRLHARIEARQNSLVLVDASSFGTWVRFAGSDTDQALRRGECVLTGKGEIALGAPFSDFSVPTIAFSLL